LSYEEFNRLKDLDVVLHRHPKWEKFAEYSIQLVDQKNLSEIELPSRSDRRDTFF
jgi:hypothetical protein